MLETGVITVGNGFPADVELVLGAPAGAIVGTVMKSVQQPAAVATVTLLPAPSLRGNPVLYKRATTTAEGTFALAGITPGSYRLFAWDTIPEGGEHDAEFVAANEFRGIALTVEPGAMIHVQLPIIDTETARQ